jgi:hypothetical protein
MGPRRGDWRFSEAERTCRAPVDGEADPGRLLDRLGPGDSFGAAYHGSRRSDDRLDMAMLIEEPELHREAAPKMCAAFLRNIYAEEGAPWPCRSAPIAGGRMPPMQSVYGRPSPRPVAATRQPDFPGYRPQTNCCAPHRRLLQPRWLGWRLNNRSQHHLYRRARPRNDGRFAAALALTSRNPRRAPLHVPVLPGACLRSCA